MSLSMRPNRRRFLLYCDCKQKQSQFIYMGGIIMKKNLTEIVFILDRSGSMSGLEADTIGGFNSMIEKQRKADGEALVSTVLFDNMSEVIHDRVMPPSPRTESGMCQLPVHARFASFGSLPPLLWENFPICRSSCRVHLRRCIGRCKSCRAS